jgi:arsenite-transporting ATPase
VSSAGRPARGLDRLLDTLPTWVLVGGKGGVGKTTCAGALALRGAERGDATLLLSTDPARSLGDALGVTLGAAPHPLSAHPALHAFQLDATAARDAFLERWREILITIVDRGTYLDRDDIAGLVDAALPGADEAMALLTLLDLERQGSWRHIIVDTAPTGHTLRLLELPRTFSALVALLDVMQEKHRFMVRALTHRYGADAADRFLEEMRAEVDALRATLSDPRRAAMLLVTRPEPVVVAETTRYAASLTAVPLAVAAMVVNAVPPEPDAESMAALQALADASPDLPLFHVPLLHEPPIGMQGLVGWGDALTEGPPALVRRRRGRGRGRASSTPRRVDMPSIPIRPLTIVGGKGGVGKTTVACALGVLAATSDESVLVVSTDPAPSVGDALAIAVGDEPVAVAGADGLFAQQLDAAAAFHRFRERWQARVDALFDSLFRGRLEAAHDRQILRDLLALAPPGSDELYALAALGEMLEEQRHATIIVDPAPTGHLLRLLEMPALGLEWSHRLLRLMLKYRAISGLGDASAELLAFAKRTRALIAMLGDGARSTLLLVALDEPLVRRETERLVAEARSRGARVGGVVWNRVAPGSVLPLPVLPHVPQFEAPVATPPPRGVAALREWSVAWRVLEQDEHG